MLKYASEPSIFPEKAEANIANITAGKKNEKITWRGSLKKRMDSILRYDFIDLVILHRLPYRMMHIYVFHGLAFSQFSYKIIRSILSYYFSAFYDDHLIAIALYFIHIMR